jgi:hypothetical protein
VNVAKETHRLRITILRNSDEDLACTNIYAGGVAVKNWQLLDLLFVFGITSSL